MENILCSTSADLLGPMTGRNCHDVVQLQRGFTVRVVAWRNGGLLRLVVQFWDVAVLESLLDEAWFPLLPISWSYPLPSRSSAWIMNLLYAVAAQSPLLTQKWGPWATAEVRSVPGACDHCWGPWEWLMAIGWLRLGLPSKKSQHRDPSISQDRWVSGCQWLPWVGGLEHGLTILRQSQAADVHHVERPKSEMGMVSESGFAFPAILGHYTLEHFWPAQSAVHFDLKAARKWPASTMFCALC